jgi:hypothetical protein
MICIKTPGSGKWHYVRDGRPLCGVGGAEIDRRDLGLAGNEEIICSNCDGKLRWLGRATRRARNLKATAPRTVYRPIHREHFEISVTHLARTAPATSVRDD